jgi:hypothetical protein
MMKTSFNAAVQLREIRENEDRISLTYPSWRSGIGNLSGLGSKDRVLEVCEFRGEGEADVKDERCYSDRSRWN